MGAKYLRLLFVSALCLCLLFFHTGCSDKKTSKAESLHDKIEKGKNKNANMQKRDFNYKQLAVSDACLEKYDLCIDNCKTNSCEETCADALSACEKDLPLELKTIKK